MKKIISILISVLLLVSIIPTVWADNGSTDDHKREILDALGIMSIENDSEYVTRKEFFNGLLYMVYDSFDEKTVKELLAGKGIILDESDNLYAGDNYITYNDAIAAVVTMLGYDQIARWGGDYAEGYKKIAREVGLLKGVVGERTLSIKREYLANLLYNAIKAEPATMVFSGGGISYETAKGETILSASRNIYEIEGILEANQYTSLTSEKGNSREQVTISGENYYINGTNASELLGCYVKGYFQKWDSDDGKIIYLGVEKERMSEIVIEADDILSVSSDCRKIEYQRNNGSNRRANISSKVRVIYNGKFWDGYTSNDFEVKNGNLKLVDYNSDNEYDCVFITSYETMIVDYINRQDFEVYGQYKYSGALNYLKLEDSNDNQNIHYYLDGEEAKFINISKDDVMTIQRSKGTNDIIANVYISRNTVSGSIKAFDKNEKKIIIEDTEYDMLQDCISEIDLLGGIELSSEYLFYIDNFGKVAYLKIAQTTDYCLFYKIKYDRRNDEYNVDYMKDNSEWEQAPLAKKVNYNGVKVTADVVYDEIELLDPQIVIIKCNSAGQIKTFITATIGYKGDQLLTKRPESSWMYKSEPKAFEYQYLFPESDAKVFVIPAVKSNDKSDYYVTTSGYFQNGVKYTLAAYDVDEFNFSGLICVKEDPLTDKKNGSFFIVDKVIRRLNDDGDTVTVVQGSMGVYANLEYAAKDEHTLDGVSKGSIINIHTDKANRIDNYEVLTPANAYKSSVNDNELHFIDCDVMASDFSAGKLKVKRRTVSDDIYLRHNKSASVYIFDTTANTYEPGSPKDVIRGDHVYIYEKSATTQEIIIFR